MNNQAMAARAPGERKAMTWQVFGELLATTRLNLISTNVVANVLVPFLQVITMNSDCVTRTLFRDLHSFTIREDNEVIILPARQYFNNPTKKMIECVGHEHYSHGTLHCDVLDSNDRTIPAVDTTLGKYWYLDGKLGRPDSGATVITAKTLQWHKNGVLHRKDSPAYVEFDKPIWNSTTRQFIYDHINEDWDVDIWTDDPDSPKPIKLLWYNRGRQYDMFSECIFVHAGYQAPKSDPWQTFKDFLWFMIPCFVTIAVIIIAAAFGEVPENPIYF